MKIRDVLGEISNRRPDKPANADYHGEIVVRLLDNDVLGIRWGNDHHWVEVRGSNYWQYDGNDPLHQLIDKITGNISDLMNGVEVPIFSWYPEYAELAHHLTNQAMTESGAQIWHIKQATGSGPFIIMSGWRSNNSRSANRAANHQIKQEVLKYGLGVIEQKGFWPIERDQNGQIIGTGHEDSLLIPMNQPTSHIKNPAEFFQLANALMIQYNQDAIIVNDGKATSMHFNPSRPDSRHLHGVNPPERLGDHTRVFGAKQDIGDAQAWSQKRNYRYTIA